MQQEDGLEHHQSRYPAASLGGSRIRPEKEPAYPTRAHTLRMLGMGEREGGGRIGKGLSLCLGLAGEKSKSTRCFHLGKQAPWAHVCSNTY